MADEIISPDFVAHFAPVGPSPTEVRGPQGLKQWIGGMMAPFAGHQYSTTVGPIADGDTIAGRWVFRATYRGGFPGTPDTALGRAVEYAGIDILRVVDGKLVEYRLCADILQLLQQLGLFPS